MEFHARLIHAEGSARVVLVTARAEGRSLGSALGEAATAEEAEDRAHLRLLARLQPAPLQASPPAPHPLRPQIGAELAAASRPSVPAGAARPAGAAGGELSAQPQGGTAGGAIDAVLPPIPEPDADGSATTATPAAAMARAGAEPPSGPQADVPQQAPAEPEDWSSELAAVERQLRRLGWGREQEGRYLQRAFGHPSRSRLTRYGDLCAYLAALKAIAAGSDPTLAGVPLRRGELLAQADDLLSQLGWSAEQGRQLLERELQRSSRSQLSEEQLLQFNMLLESELLQARTAEPPPQTVAGEGQR